MMIPNGFPIADQKRGLQQQNAILMGFINRNVETDMRIRWVWLKRWVYTLKQMQIASVQSCLTCGFEGFPGNFRQAHVSRSKTSLYMFSNGLVIARWA